MKNTFLEYVHPEPKLIGRRMRAFSDTAILEGSSEDDAATHCKSIGSRVPEAAAALAAAAAKEAAALEEKTINVSEQEKDMYYSVPMEPYCVQWWMPTFAGCDGQMVDAYGHDPFGQQHGFAMAPMGMMPFGDYGEYGEYIDYGNDYGEYAMAAAPGSLAMEMGEMDVQYHAACEDVQYCFAAASCEDVQYQTAYAPSALSTAEPVCTSQSNTPDQFSELSESVDETRTTVMLRNLPNNYTCDMLLELVDAMGFSGRYDLVYLPVDFSTGAGLGYAFVNLVCPQDVPNFWEGFAGFCDWVVPSDKVCSVTWSHPHQGLQSHLERYRNSPVMHASVPDGWKPALFENGMRVPFPTPTKKLKAPRIKCLENA